MEVDTSAYAVGAILFQKDDQERKQDVGYYSKALNPAECNYDIWDQEFLAVIKALGNWHHILIGTPHKITVWTDHANLQYYRQPQKVNKEVVAMPESIFIKDIEMTGINHIIAKLQEQHGSEMKKWEEEQNLQQNKQGWYHKGIALVVPDDTKLRRDLVELNHDSPTAAHPGIDKTHRSLIRQYWWPRCKEFV